MKTRSIALALVFAFAPIAIGAPAFAQPADDPSVKAARARFQEGVGFYDKGEFENARAAFLQAYALRKHPAVLLNLAQSSLRSGHALEAAKYFQQYLRESQNLSPAQRADAERGLSEARQKLARLEIIAPAGSILVVDGEGAGTAPLPEPLDVEPGSHKVKAGNEEQNVATVAGQKATAKFGPGGAAPLPVPVPLPTPATPPNNTPATPQPVAPTDTQANANANNNNTVVVNVGDTRANEPKKSPLAPPANMIPVYVGGVVALVGVGIGIGVGVIAKSSAQNSADSVAAEIRKNGGTNGVCSAATGTQTYTKFHAACAALSDDNSKVDTDAAVGNIGLAVGIAGAAFAVGWYLFAPKKSAESAPAAGTWKTPKVTPILGMRENGLSLSGEF